jgi:hypothetical protein
MLIWISFFSIYSLILGVKTDPEEYSGIDYRIKTFINTYRNAIGDIMSPDYSIYLNEE